MAFECTACGRLKTHKKIVHKRKRPFKCSKGGNSFPDKTKRNRHVKVHNKEASMNKDIHKGSHVVINTNHMSQVVSVSIFS